MSINESRTDSFFSYQIQTWQSWQPGKTPQSTSSWKHCHVWNKSKQIKKNSHYSCSWMRGREFGSTKKMKNTFHICIFLAFSGSKKLFTKELCMLLSSPSLTFWSVNKILINNKSLQIVQPSNTHLWIWRKWRSAQEEEAFCNSTNSKINSVWQLICLGSESMFGFDSDV